MKTYNNDIKLKKMFVEEIISHRKADQIIQGTYGKEGEKWKGCAVGCSIHSLNIKLGKSYPTSDHTVYEKELGIPEWMARLEDTIFEGLTVEESKMWPEQFAEAINVGVDLEPVKWKFCSFILKDNIERVLALDIEDDLKKQVVDSIRGVLSLHEDAIITGKWDSSAAKSPESATRSAARSAAWSVAWSVPESAAWSAAWSAESAAWSAAESVAESAAWSATMSAARSAAESAWSTTRSATRSAARSAAESARSAAYTKYATELLRLLTELK